jgi:uncharacterized protein (DUF1810 family)
MPGGADPFNLLRFVRAQDQVYADVVAELTAGRKRTHWMWFVFPQLKGLGRSATALEYGIGSPEEALAYLGHAALGPRLEECAGLVARHAGRPVEAIFGYPDTLKFRSSMTLFAAVRPEEALFGELLDTFFQGERDGSTLALLAR